MDARFKPKHPYSVTAAELVRNFAECRESAVKHELHVTHHGRATHVLLGIEQYEGLLATAEHPRSVSAESGTLLLHMLAEWLDDAVILCDEEMNILFVNRVTQAVCRKPAQELAGFPLLEALPQVAGSMLEVHARRTASGSESSSADIPSPFHKDRWLRFQSLPLGNWNVLMFRDITDTVQRDRFADVKEAILDAMNLHGSIAYARVSIRGTIEQVNDPCTQLIGLPRERLQGIALADVIATSDRRNFREALESVIRSARGHRFNARILTNSGDLSPVHLALEPLHGAYGAEGAVMLATPLLGPEIAGRE